MILRHNQDKAMTKSEQMARFRTTGTAPEMRLWKELWTRGLRYRVQNHFYGTSGLIFVKSRVVVFVDGCFWHGYPEHYTYPATNTAFLENKFGKSRRRDRRVNAQLEELDWSVIRVWEHDIKNNLSRVVGSIALKMSDCNLRFKKAGAGGGLQLDHCAGASS